MEPKRVRVLPDEVANRIAAGEVVERPASVVKELVENAVDAGASHVRVRVEGAGKVLVAVEDDGSGMPREDALLALERHATSKLASFEDLERIETLGFRGEALPSIASVSRFTLLTRPDGKPEGTRILVEGGLLVSAELAGAARGTTVEIRDLFFNVPARRKFLKGDATELRNIVETLTLLALVHPSVGFELRSGGRLLLAVPPGLGVEERAAELVGPEAPGGLFWHRTEGEGRKAALAFAAPHEGRGHAKGVRLFVNGRPVQDRMLFRALAEGFRGVLAPGRHPLALLWLDLPPDEVDVNVHPAKREVRFRDEGRVFRWVAGTAAEAAACAPWARPPATPGPGKPGEGDAFGVQEIPAPLEDGRRQRVAEAIAAYGERAQRHPEALERAWGRGAPAPLPFPAPAPRTSPPRHAEAVAGIGPFGELDYLGTFAATYLVFADRSGGDLVLLDQHAAHERLLYEALLGRDRGVALPQPLLFPVTLECSASELAAFAERRAEIESLGFRVEAFGPRSLAVSEAPQGVPAEAVEPAVRDLLSGAEPGDAGQRDRREALAARAACAAAVKAGSALVAAEVGELLHRLGALLNPTHCPHGRPVLVRLSKADIEKMFHRR